ncbi:MAG: SDR family oxidoreductase [Actinobacteria bacterium]|nr:SDR family oxidoreductase [Actinomycetota bacterium]
MPAHSSHSLAGRTALVTGVSRHEGIGFAIAHRLRSMGALVFVQSWRAHDQDQPWGTGQIPLEQLLAELGSSSLHLPIDLSHSEAPLRLVEAARVALGHIDILIANHARSSQQSLEQLTAEELDLSFQVNARSTLLLIKEWAAQYDDAKTTGRVIMLTSGQHLEPMPSEIPYAAAKAVIQQMTPTLASHLGRRRITVNSINPGPTDTGWATPQTHERVLRQMPFGRWGAPDDAASLVAWLASDEGQWITGQTINSEGGFSLRD